MLNVNGVSRARAQTSVVSQAAARAKERVRFATAAALPAYTRTGNTIEANVNGAINGHASVDGVAAVIVGNRFLLKDGAAGPDNGLWEFTAVGAAGAKWSARRSVDADGSADMKPGTLIFVSEGTANGNKTFQLTTDDPIVLNTTALTFAEATAAAPGANSIAGSQLTAVSRKRTVAMPIADQLPAPTGANQLGLGRYLWTAPSALTVLAFRIVSDTATAGSDATNRYAMNLINLSTGNEFRPAALVNTNGGELAAGTEQGGDATQNQAVASGARIGLIVDIFDDGGAGPTDLSGALIRVEIDYEVTG